MSAEDALDKAGVRYDSARAVLSAMMGDDTSLGITVLLTPNYASVTGDDPDDDGWIARRGDYDAAAESVTKQILDGSIHLDGDGPLTPAFDELRRECAPEIIYSRHASSCYGELLRDDIRQLYEYLVDTAPPSEIFSLLDSLDLAHHIGVDITA
jgi:hypothetical protein